MLGQILTDPDDDDLRMVYADHLISRGDPRGEYIAIELGLSAALRGSKKHAALARRRTELRVAHATEWWPELPVRRIGTRHGFVKRVAVFRAELGGLEELAAREPVTAVELLDPCQELTADAPWLRRLRRLVVHGGGIEALLPLLDGAVGLEELVLTSGYTLPVLGPRLPRCRSLCLAGMDLHEIDNSRLSPLRTLAEWDHLERLEVLDLSHCGASATAVTRLHLPSLRELRLSGNRLGPQGAASLAQRLPALPALQRIHLLDTGIGARDAEVLRTVGPRVRLLVDKPPPGHILLDAVGTELELLQESESEWVILLDGVRKSIHVRRHNHETLEHHAALGRIVHALWKGAPRRFRSRDFAVVLAGEALWVAPDHSEVRYEPSVLPNVMDDDDLPGFG